MRPIFVLSCVAAAAVVFVRTAGVAHAVPQQIPFDRAYMVAAPGSTTPVYSFDITGPPPVLYLDLPPRPVTG